MPTGEQFGTNVPQTTTTSPVPSGNPTVPVNSASGWPSTPFTAFLGLGTSLQECVYVTTVAGTTWTVTRGYDGTIQQNHPLGQTVTFATSGHHFTEPRSHIDSSGPVDASSTAVHGLTNTAGNHVVGTAETQTLTNKTITSPSIQGTVGGSASYTSPTLTGVVGGGATYTAPSFSGTVGMGSGTWTGTGGLAENTLTANGITGAVAGAVRFAGSVNGGPPTSGTFLTDDIILDISNWGFWVCTSGGSPGTWRPASGKYLIATSTPSGLSSTTFPSIPQYFTHLRLEYDLKSSSATGTGVDAFALQINGVTSNYNYEYTGWSQAGTSPAANANAQTMMTCGLLWSSAVATNGSGRGFIDIPFYSETNFVKSVNFQSTASDSSSVGISIAGGGTAGGTTNTVAVTSVTLLTRAGNFAANSRINLYGII